VFKVYHLLAMIWTLTETQIVYLRW